MRCDGKNIGFDQSRFLKKYKRKYFWFNVNANLARSLANVRWQFIYNLQQSDQPYTEGFEVYVEHPECDELIIDGGVSGNELIIDGGISTIANVGIVTGGLTSALGIGVCISLAVRKYQLWCFAPESAAASEDAEASAAFYPAGNPRPEVPTDDQEESDEEE